MRKLLASICLLTFAVVIAGCGTSGGSDSSDDKGDATTTTAAADDETTTTKAGGTTAQGDASAAEYEAALVTNLSSGSEDDGQLVLEQAQAECVGPKWVAAMTVETLKAHDVTPDQMSDPSWDGSDLGLSVDQGREMVDAFDACDVDIDQLFIEALTGGLTADQQKCAAENVDHDLVVALLSKSFSTEDSDAELEALTADLTSKCDLPAN